MVAGETGVDGGELAFEKGARVALHYERPPRERGLSVRDYVLAGCRDLVALEEELRGLEGEMAERPEDRDLLDRYSRVQGRLEHAGGWNWRERAMAPLHGLGFADAQLDRSLDTFLGGELTRASLARVVAAEVDVLLLDEPTNHLDIGARAAGGLLVELDATVVVVGHDRWFLEAVGTSVLELEAGRSRFFPGSWHNWRMEAAAREIQLGKQIEKQQTEIARMERFIERFRYKATKARQAQSRVKRLEKMERIERDPRDNRSLGFSFGTAERTGRVVLELEGGRLDVPGARWSRMASCGSTRRARLARRPQRIGQDHSDRGARRPGARRRRAGQGTTSSLGIPHPACRGARLERHRARGGGARDRPYPEQGSRAAGRFLFSGDDVEKKVRRAVGRRAAPAVAGAPL